ncbi:type II toxin-antitoxin system death-on-curing family toxin [Rhizobium sp. CSW-27]|uniref:type II toxin-antitoxin system death-on-curing family toxin n=1 Tax=Rhizobium sp. CSW-27 TaxID=2839985 RepID=UPI001C01F1F0|nr:type II toxin-antitoxin system death-on-curing family toxin [Rhizobium sp. CSW-27]MBT9368391.1 type II toxin-antitoxin system death-on-curing family toxin [Rhizobium sp. CSW-27]
MSDVRFLSKALIIELHKRQIARFGGADGLRDVGLLESALARPVDRNLYGSDNLTELAAAYLFGLARNHAFVDGNKRIAIVAAGVFLMENGLMIEVTDAAMFSFVMAVAAGEIDEEGCMQFLRDHTVPYPAATP